MCVSPQVEVRDHFLPCSYILQTSCLYLPFPYKSARVTNVLHWAGFTWVLSIQTQVLLPEEQ